MIRHVDASPPRHAQPRRRPPGRPGQPYDPALGGGHARQRDRPARPPRQLLRLFPSTVELPPLRLHLEDLPLLVPVFLSRLGQGRHLACSPEAMRLLMRMSWPGNAEQLHEHAARGGQAPAERLHHAEDLPPEVHAVSRRVLSPLEAMERDAIVKCLADANGNKVRAARSLGMSRATIYRKIHDYGIVPPTAPADVSH